MLVVLVGWGGFRVIWDDGVIRMYIGGEVV